MARPPRGLPHIPPSLLAIQTPAVRSKLLGLGPADGTPTPRATRPRRPAAPDFAVVLRSRCEATDDAVTLHLPGLRLRLTQNSRLHWSARHRVVARQRATVRAAFARAEKLAAVVRGFTVVVTITRVANCGKKLDVDNLSSSCKGVQDEVAAFLGVDDGDERWVTWRYEARRGPAAVVVELRKQSRP